jgi:hypothetical protein
MQAVAGFAALAAALLCSSVPVWGEVLATGKLEKCVADGEVSSSLCSQRHEGPSAAVEGPAWTLRGVINAYTDPYEAAQWPAPRLPSRRASSAATSSWSRSLWQTAKTFALSSWSSVYPA